MAFEARSEKPREPKRTSREEAVILHKQTLVRTHFEYSIADNELFAGSSIGWGNISGKGVSSKVLNIMK